MYRRDSRGGKLEETVSIRQKVKFRRQHPIGPYIVDFYCSQYGLILEVDGGIHYQDEATLLKDKQRQTFLEMKGYIVLRFTTRDIRQSISLVLQSIFNQTLLKS